MSNTIKVYTKTGDKGETSLSTGQRILKDDVRIESYGTIDELNSIVGICRQNLPDVPAHEAELLEKWFHAVQNDLFNLGADLATPIEKRFERMVILDADNVKALENIIDFCQDKLPILRKFVLPGGNSLNAYLHLARTVCRRAERIAVTLAREEEINPFAIPFINRLSDLFFVLSRWVLLASQKEEITWDPKMGLKNIFVLSE